MTTARPEQCACVCVCRTAGLEWIHCLDKHRLTEIEEALIFTIERYCVGSIAKNCPHFLMK